MSSLARHDVTPGLTPCHPRKETTHATRQCMHQFVRSHRGGYRSCPDRRHPWHHPLFAAKAAAAAPAKQTRRSRATSLRPAPAPARRQHGQNKTPTQHQHWQNETPIQHLHQHQHGSITRKPKRQSQHQHGAAPAKPKRRSTASTRTCTSISTAAAPAKPKRSKASTCTSMSTATALAKPKRRSRATPLRSWNPYSLQLSGEKKQCRRATWQKKGIRKKTRGKEKDLYRFPGVFLKTFSRCLSVRSGS